MKRFTSIAAAMLAGLFSSCVPEAEAQPTESRTIILDNVIRAPAVLDQANRLFVLAQDPKPVRIVLNSPGGAVFAGMQFINAMELARSKGVTFDCYVPGMAASMAFQILLHCDNRYFLRYSLLLWHPVRVSGLFTLTPYKAKYLAWTLREIEKRMMIQLYDKLGDKKFVEYHYLNETMWSAEGLLTVVPGFGTIVDDMPMDLTGIWQPGKMKRNKAGQIKWDEFEIGGDKKEDPEPTPSPRPAPDCRSCHTKPHGGDK